MEKPLLDRDPDILGGAPLFVGTTVPVDELFGFLTDGWTIDDFVPAYPSVNREYAIAVFRWACESLIETVAESS